MASLEDRLRVCTAEGRSRCKMNLAKLYASSRVTAHVDITENASAANGPTICPGPLSTASGIAGTAGKGMLSLMRRTQQMRGNFDYAEALRLMRKFGTDAKEPVGQMFVRMARRVEALEMVIAEELNPNDCLDETNAELVEDIHKRSDGIIDQKDAADAR